MTAPGCFRCAPEGSAAATPPRVVAAVPAAQGREDPAGAQSALEEGEDPVAAAAVRDGVVEVCRNLGHEAARYGSIVIFLAGGNYIVGEGRYRKLAARERGGHS